jgi:hypothetical protein
VTASHDVLLPPPVSEDQTFCITCQARPAGLFLSLLT